MYFSVIYQRHFVLQMAQQTMLLLTCVRLMNMNKIRIAINLPKNRSIFLFEFHFILPIFLIVITFYGLFSWQKEGKKEKEQRMIIKCPKPKCHFITAMLQFHWFLLDSFIRLYRLQIIHQEITLYPVYILMEPLLFNTRNRMMIVYKIISCCNVVIVSVLPP